MTPLQHVLQTIDAHPGISTERIKDATKTDHTVLRLLLGELDRNALIVETDRDKWDLTKFGDEVLAARGAGSDS